MTNGMVPTPICIFFACREFNKKNSKKIQKKGHFKVIFEKKTSEKLLKQSSQVGGSYFQVLHLITIRMVPTPHLYLSCM